MTGNPRHMSSWITTGGVALLVLAASLFGWYRSKHSPERTERVSREKTTIPDDRDMIEAINRLSGQPEMDVLPGTSEHYRYWIVKRVANRPIMRGDLVRGRLTFSRSTSQNTGEAKETVVTFTAGDPAAPAILNVMAMRMAQGYIGEVWIAQRCFGRLPFPRMEPALEVRTRIEILEVKVAG